MDLPKKLEIIATGSLSVILPIQYNNILIYISQVGLVSQLAYSKQTPCDGAVTKGVGSPG